MDDLKNIVIQNLEQEGTLGNLRAQLRSRVFKAIENYADSNAKQTAGFQWQSPAAKNVHEDPDTKLVALLVKDFLEHYKMDYTLSVYLPEISLSNAGEHPTKDEVAQKAGLAKNGDGPLLLQLLKQKQGSGGPAPTTTESKPEETKQAPAKSPFTNNSAAAVAAKDTKAEEIEEDIV